MKTINYKNKEWQNRNITYSWDDTFNEFWYELDKIIKQWAYDIRIFTENDIWLDSNKVVKVL